MTDTSDARCPHCDGELHKWIVPVESTWTSEYFLVCFNDECPYYRRGWDFIQKSINVQASYRYCLDPETGKNQPIPVWSDDALRNGIRE